MIHEEICTYEVAKLAKEKGFNEYCDYTYYNHYRVRDEIKIKHPGLSDDGYEDLRKMYGGPYSDNELYGYYIEAIHLSSRNSTIGINPITKKPCATSEICSAPTQNILRRWLREEKGIHIAVFPNMSNSFEFDYIVYIKGDKFWNPMYTAHSDFATYELALEDALKYVIEKLI